MMSKWKNILCQDSLFFVVTLQLIMLFFLPPMDGKMSIFRAIIYVFFAILSLVVVGIYLKRYVLGRKMVLDGTFWCVIAFFLLCVVSSIWGLTRGIPLNDIIRGILPFIWFVYIIILTQAFDREKIRQLLMLLNCIAVLYAVRILLYYFVYVVGRPNERVTFHLVQATSIMPMLGSMLLGYLFIIGKKCNIGLWVVSLVCYIATILTATKAMLLALIAGWAIFILLIFLLCKNQYTEQRYIVKNVIRIVISMLVCMGILFGLTSIGNRWKNMIRVSDIKTEQNEGNKQEDMTQIGDKTIVVIDQGSITVRLIELRTAIDGFRESPLLGKGIGYRWTAKGIDYGEAVIYMHNIIAFILLDFGMIGIIYIVVILCILLNLLRVVWKKRNNIHKDKMYFLIIYATILMAFAYANFFAVFRSIEYVIICSVLFVALSLESKEIMKDE